MGGQRCRGEIPGRVGLQEQVPPCPALLGLGQRSRRRWTWIHLFCKTSIWIWPPEENIAAEHRRPDVCLHCSQSDQEGTRRLFTFLKINLAEKMNAETVNTEKISQYGKEIDVVSDEVRPIFGSLKLYLCPDGNQCRSYNCCWAQYAWNKWVRIWNNRFRIRYKTARLSNWQCQFKICGKVSKGLIYIYIDSVKVI